MRLNSLPALPYHQDGRVAEVNRLGRRVQGSEARSGAKRQCQRGGENVVLCLQSEDNSEGPIAGFLDWQAAYTEGTSSSACMPMCTHKKESKNFSKNLIYFSKHQSSILGKIKILLDFLTRILWVSIVFNFNYIWPVGGRGCTVCSELKASKGLKTQPWWPLKSLSLSFGA